MSLPACQQRVLDTIENALQKREPRLTSMFAIFTRLTHGEGLPRTERLDARWWSRRRRWHPRQPGRPPRPLWFHGQPAAAMRAWLIIPVLIALVGAAVFLSMSSSAAYCLPSAEPHGLIASKSQPTNCSSPQGSPYVGHGP